MNIGNTAIGQNKQVRAGQVRGGRVTDYLALLKPRVMSLVLFTALVGLMLAPGCTIPPMVPAPTAALHIVGSQLSQQP